MLLLYGCGNNTICYESILPINKTFRSWCFLKELVYWMIVGVIHRIFDGRILLGGSSLWILLANLLLLIQNLYYR